MGHALLPTGDSGDTPCPPGYHPDFLVDTLIAVVRVEQDGAGCRIASHVYISLGAACLVCFALASTPNISKDVGKHQGQEVGPRVQ